MMHLFINKVSEAIQKTENLKELASSLLCIAVPIKDYSGNVIGGISISGSADRINPEKY